MAKPAARPPTEVARAPMTIRLILGFILAYLLALVGTPMAREAALRFGVVDRPDGKLKNHDQPVAYLGGLAVFSAFLMSIGMTFEFDAELLALLLASTIVTTVGLVDDFGVLTPKPKVIGQVVAVFVLLKAGIMVQVAFIPWWLRLVITVLWLVGLSNAFNLVDIMDGLASGLGVIAATFLLVVALLNGRLVVAAFTVALIGALLGFLRSNFHPATIYLGDCGSLFIGFNLGALAMVMDYTSHNPLGWLAPLYILAVPLVDTLYVIVLRIRAGRRIYYGSPDHFPLRVRRRLDGWTAGTVVVSYAVATIFGALGLVVLFLDPMSTLILTGVVGMVVASLLLWLALVPMESG
jgi:UDP-GlcNAc:undecaprenyl-phosphate GlcNAc-1-phosphate transferase